MDKFVDLLINGDLGNEDVREKLLNLVATTTERALLAWQKSNKSPLPLNTPYFDEPVLLDVIAQTQHSVKTYTAPNELKVGGHLTYWIQKLKPCHPQPKMANFTNEIIGLLLGFGVIAAKNGNSSKKIGSELLSNWVYDFRYKDICSNSIINFFASIFHSDEEDAQKEIEEVTEAFSDAC